MPNYGVPPEDRHLQYQSHSLSHSPQQATPTFPQQSFQHHYSQLSNSFTAHPHIPGRAGAEPLPQQSYPSQPGQFAARPPPTTVPPTPVDTPRSPTSNPFGARPSSEYDGFSFDRDGVSHTQLGHTPSQNQGPTHQNLGMQPSFHAHQGVPPQYARVPHALAVQNQLHTASRGSPHAVPHGLSLSQSLPLESLLPQWDPTESLFPDMSDTHDFYLSSDLANPSLESINESVGHNLHHIANPFSSDEPFFPPPPIRTDFIALFTPSFSDAVSDYSDTSESSRYNQRNKSNSSIGASPQTSKITKKPSFSRKTSLPRLPKAVDPGISPLINNYINLNLNGPARSDLLASSRSEDHPISRKSSRMSLSEAAAATLVVVGPKKHTRRKLNPRSRNGCWICRIKHLKCNEERPVCLGCKKYGLECDYSAEKPGYVTDKVLRQEKLQQIARPRNKPKTDELVRLV